MRSIGFVTNRRRTRQRPTLPINIGRKLFAMATACLVVGGMLIPAPAWAKQNNVDICHLDQDTGQFELISVSDNGNAVSAHLAHGDGFPGQDVPGMSGFIFDTQCGLDAMPVIEDQTFSIAENSPNGTLVGTIVSSDPDPGDIVTLSVTGGTGTAAFAVDPVSGDITVADQSLLDFETTPSFTLDVVATDLDGATDTAVLTIDLSDVLECIASEAELRAAAAAGGDYCVDATSPIVLTAGEVSVETTLSLTSTGPGNAVIDANQTGRVFNVTGSLTLSDITVTGGRMSGSGGGIYVHDTNAAVTLNGSSSITSNAAWSGGGVSVDQAFPSSGSLTMNGSSSITGNVADPMGANVTTAGGGLSLNGGSLTMNGASSISSNSVSGFTAIGGGILNNVGTIVMNDGSSIASNVAGPSSFANLSLGGGIYFVNGGSLTLNGAASITGNSAVDNGGGIYRIDNGFGSFTGVTATNVTGNSPNNCATNGFAPAVPGCVG